MTDVVQLFSGIGVIIDEAINEENASPNGIQKIIQSFESKHIPLIKYTELPDDYVEQFHSISFVILDWNLSGLEVIPEVTIEDNIDFIKKLKTYCFVPIFIFSDEDSHTIKIKLEENDINVSKYPIFVKSKNELDTSDKLFEEISKWLKSTPSVYVLKEWEHAERKAKNQMLWDLSVIHSAWPKVLMQAIHDDGGDKHIELMHLLQYNLSYRIDNPKFDDDIINNRLEGISKDELRRLLECERFIPNVSLPDHPFVGDIYLIDGTYYINIRPDCDIVREKKDLYLLKGCIINEDQINSGEENEIVFYKGEFQEKINQCYTAFIEGQILSFSLRKLIIMRWCQIKSKRCGRLLPPYITRIQQKYSSYLQRQGLPSIPNQAII